MMPIESALEALLLYLRDMPTEELSTQQMDVLDAMRVASLIGNRGAHWVRQTVKTSTYDPATTNEKIQNANNWLFKSLKSMTDFSNAAKSLGFDPDEQKALSLKSDRFRVSICFQHDVGINNIPDLKKRSNDWFQIINGVSEALGEKPEDTEVIGVANGSLWLFLGVTAALVKALAIISKHAREISGNTFGILNDIEEYRAKKHMNNLIERGLKQALEDVESQGLERLMEELKTVLPKNVSAEQLAKLNAAVKKMLTFIEKGGDVDFSRPIEMDKDDEGFDPEASAIVSEVKRMIEDAQEAKHTARLLEQQNNEDGGEGGN